MVPTTAAMSDLGGRRYRRLCPVQLSRQPIRIYACQAGTTALCQVWLYPPSQGLWIWLLVLYQHHKNRAHPVPVRPPPPTPLRSRANTPISSPPSGWQEGKRAVQQVIPGGEMPADLPNTRPSMYYSVRRSVGLVTKKPLILICWFATLATLCELSAASSADQVAGVADGSGTTADESRSSSMQAFQSAGLIPQILARAPKDVLQVGCLSRCSAVKPAPVLQKNVPLQSEMKWNENHSLPFRGLTQKNLSRNEKYSRFCFSIFSFPLHFALNGWLWTELQTFMIRKRHFCLVSLLLLLSMTFMMFLLCLMLISTLCFQCSEVAGVPAVHCLPAVTPSLLFLLFILLLESCCWHSFCFWCFRHRLYPVYCLRPCCACSPFCFSIHAVVGVSFAVGVLMLLTSLLLLGFPPLLLAFLLFKGTQDWDFLWLRFWNLFYFFFIYVKILRFYKKNFDWAIIGGGTFRKFNQLNASGTTLCVDLGSKCQILFPLVWD